MRGMITPTPLPRDPDPVGLVIGDQPIETFNRDPSAELTLPRTRLERPKTMLATIAVAVIAGVAIYVWRARRAAPHLATRG